MLHPRQIDAYWLQRELNKFYNDPEMSRSKSEEALEVLKVHFSITSLHRIVPVVFCLSVYAVIYS